MERISVDIVTFSLRIKLTVTGILIPEADPRGLRKTAAKRVL